MTTAAVPTEQTQTDKQQCPECGLYMGGHRLHCSKLDRSNPEAMRTAQYAEDYMRASGRIW